MLAIETSQRQGSVALRDAHGIVHVEHLRSATRHDDDLLPAVDRLVTQAGLTPRDLNVIAVSIGPGGFTGLRIAVSTAKMFAEALSVKLIAVPSALVAAYATAPAEQQVLVALASKGETFWATSLKRSDDAWHITSRPHLTQASDMLLDETDVLLGDEHLPAMVRTRCEAAGVPIIAPVFSAEACISAGLVCAANCDWTDPLELLPLYPREPEAVSKWRELHERT